IADLLGGLEPAQAGLDATSGVERAVEHTEVRVAAAGGLQELALLGQADAALDLLDRFGEAAGARQGHAERVIRLDSHDGRLAEALGLGGGVVLLRRLGQRALGPADRGGVVAGAKCQSPHLLEEMGTLDRIAAVAEVPETIGEADRSPIAVAGIPVKRADLAEHARG